jgi:NTE family protein
VRIDGVLGTRQTLGFEVWRPLGSTPIFVAPRAYYTRTPRNGYLDERLVAEYRIKRAGGGVDLGINAGRHAEVRLGVDVADVRGRIRVGSPQLPEIEGVEKYATLQAVVDTQTSPVVPTRGNFVRGRLRYHFDAPDYIGAPGQPTQASITDFWQGELSGSWFHRVGSADRMFVTYGVGSSFGDHPVINDFSLGGPLRLGAFNNDELRSDNYVLGTVGYLHTIGRLADVLGGNIYIGGWFEQGSVHEYWDDMTYRSSLSLGTVMETLLGPVYAGTSFDFDGRFRFYVGIGPLFK